jgi:hypothetical protein
MIPKRVNNLLEQTMNSVSMNTITVDRALSLSSSTSTSSSASASASSSASASVAVAAASSSDVDSIAIGCGGNSNSNGNSNDGNNNNKAMDNTDVVHVMMACSPSATTANDGYKSSRSVQSLQSKLLASRKLTGDLNGGSNAVDALNNNNNKNQNQNQNDGYPLCQYRKGFFIHLKLKNLITSVSHYFIFNFCFFQVQIKCIEFVLSRDLFCLFVKS